MDKKIPSDKSGCPHESVLQTGLISHFAENIRPEHKTVSDERIKWVSGNLYECISGDKDCSYRYSFGFRYFCSWLLNDNSGGLDDKPPCYRRGEENA